VARLACVDFSLQLVVNHEKRIVRAFGGDLFETHTSACDYVKGKACPVVEAEADVVVTGCGGYPLDATFYQCTKALVTALPCVRKGGLGVKIMETGLERIAGELQKTVDDLARKQCSFAVIPEGPYCAPLSKGLV